MGQNIKKTTKVEEASKPVKKTKKVEEASKPVKKTKKVETEEKIETLGPARYVLVSIREDESKILDTKNKNYTYKDDKIYDDNNKAIGTVIKKSNNVCDLHEENDILIVKFADAFYYEDMVRPIFACNLQEYEVPIALLKRDPKGNYTEYRRTKE